MITYLSYVEATAKGYRAGSLVGETLHWMNRNGFLRAPSTPPDCYGQRAIEDLILVVIRFTAAHFIYPRAAPLASLLYNVPLGVLHLGIGCAYRFQTPDNALNDQRNHIESNFEKGIAHLLFASYDVGIGYALKFKPCGVLFALFPAHIQLANSKMYSQNDSSTVPNQRETTLDDQSAPFPSSSTSGTSGIISDLAHRIVMTAMPLLHPNPTSTNPTEEAPG